MKIALCLPVHDHTKAQFTMSALSMLAHTFKARPDIEFQVHMYHKCSRIEEAREKLAGMAIEGAADRLFWVDSDQTFPPETLLRLLGHDLPIVGCNYRKRIPDRIVPASRNLIEGRIAGAEPKAEGIEKVDLLGFGVVLIKASVFEGLPRPWFASGPYGEDGYFCQQALAHGVPAYIDHALSMEVGHVAETVLTFPR